jgi:hypothetical protein
MMWIFIFVTDMNTMYIIYFRFKHTHSGQLLNNFIADSVWPKNATGAKAKNFLTWNK